MQIAELAEMLLQRDQNVLFADTCTILDVIRSPVRSQMDVLETACRMSREISVDSLPFSVVVSDLFALEWSRNIDSVRDTLTAGLRAHSALSATAGKLHQLMHGAPLSIPDLTSYGFAEALENICIQIIAAAHIAPREEFYERASNRQINRIAPAGVGKSEGNDCLIFESFLGLAEQLRARGSARRIVFVSSNTSDYGKLNNVKPDIAKDLALFDADFAASLNHGYYLASRADPNAPS